MYLATANSTHHKTRPFFFVSQHSLNDLFTRPFKPTLLPLKHTTWHWHYSPVALRSHWHTPRWPLLTPTHPSLSPAHTDTPHADPCSHRHIPRWFLLTPTHSTLIPAHTDTPHADSCSHRHTPRKPLLTPSSNTSTPHHQLASSATPEPR